jgi:hypothetical protein
MALDFAKCVACLFQDQQQDLRLWMTALASANAAGRFTKPDRFEFIDTGQML